MAAPTTAIMLHGAGGSGLSSKHGSRIAIQLRLSHRTLKDIRETARDKSVLQLVTGKQPKLRLGNRSIDVNILPSAYTTELYTASTATDLNFEANITYEGKLHDLPRPIDTAGADDALATLQNTIASYNEEKKAKATTITDRVLPEFKSRFEAAKKQKRGGLLGMGSVSGASSPALSGVGTPSFGPTVTSAPTGTALKDKAMRTATIHLLAMAAVTTDAVMGKTHIPRADLDTILSKLGQQEDGKWRLLDRMYKELDVWTFGYMSQDDRQKAVENGIRAFDRLRIGKEEQIWQKLLPEKDRGKGIVLSKLHLGNGGQSKGLTPNRAPSPRPHSAVTDDDEGGVTPRPGSSHTPKVGAAKTNGDMKKRLLSKDPKKARAVEDAKEKKRKEREVAAATSDREGPKKAGTPSLKSTGVKAVSAKVKSAELVYSSDDDRDADDGEVKNAPSRSTPKVRPSNAKTALTGKVRSAPASSPDSSDEHVKRAKSTSRDTPLARVNGAKVTKPPKASSTPNTSRPSAVGKSTPHLHDSAAISSPHCKAQATSSTSQRKPGISSPLGTTRPRVTSDVSDRSAIVVQREKQGAETPKGLGITTGTSIARKRHDTVLSQSTTTGSEPDKAKHAPAPDRARYTLTNSAKSAAGKDSSKPETVTTSSKRKADTELNPGTATQRRKVITASPASQRSHSSSTATMSSMNTAQSTSPDQETSISSDSSSEIINNITFTQGVRLAQEFRDKLYPAYAKAYDEVMRKKSEGETVGEPEMTKLLDMHRRLEVTKREIEAASLRQDG
ncbi:hypothetical protein B0A48_12380 [Cryoendolithus antarcticus]|uniref:Uncharacterized protein n=1 Tax=Cryoendolithus antarcticus TaxID=1507870 RepID=A0A1V8SRU6_9PEZI|nr:hypothetical protein B0A48_12380 [Cryoendolithus antarcticus]